MCGRHQVKATLYRQVEYASANRISIQEFQRECHSTCDTAKMPALVLQLVEQLVQSKAAIAHLNKAV
jgi:hypothetical protein